LKNGLERHRDVVPNFLALSESQEIREVGRSVFGQPAVKKARDGFFNGLITEEAF